MREDLMKKFLTYLSKDSNKSVSYKIKPAMTLAEILIVIGVIGIIAALTIPSLINKYQQNVAIEQLKKAYSSLQQAVDMLRANAGGIDTVDMDFVHQQWNHPQYFDLDIFIPEFTKVLKIISESNPADSNSWDESIKMCLPSDSTRQYKGTNNNIFSTALIGNPSHVWQLQNGSCLGILRRGDWTWDESNGIVLFIIDVDGSEKGFDAFGKDTFIFQYIPNGKIEPYGYNSTVIDYNACNSSSPGVYCAAKIIEDGWKINSDYPW